MSETFVIRHVSGRYLEQRPFDGAWTFLASDSRFATVFDEEAGEALTMQFRAAGEDVALVPDLYWRRPAQVKGAA